MTTLHFGARRRHVLPALAALAIAACVPAVAAASPPDTSPDGSLADTPAPRPLDESTTLRVTIPINVEGVADVLLGIEFGEFERENLDIEVINIPASDALVLLNTGDADIVVGSPSAAFLNTLAEGFDNRWIAPTYEPNPDSIAGLWINSSLLGDDGVAQPEEVQGMSVALGALGLAAPSALPVDLFLNDLGLTLGDIEVANMQGADMVTAMENGAIDAGVVLDPFNRQVEQGGFATFVQPFPPDSVGGYIAGDIREQPEVIDAFVRGLLRTRRTYLQGDYHANPDVVAALAEVLGVDAELITSNPSLVWDPDAQINPQTIEDMQAMWIEGGILEVTEPFVPEDVIDQSAIDRVLAEG